MPVRNILFLLEDPSFCIAQPFFHTESTVLTRFSGGLFTDIRDLICVDDVMEDDDLRFGPNGGLIFCME